MLATSLSAPFKYSIAGELAGRGHAAAEADARTQKAPSFLNLKFAQTGVEDEMNLNPTDAIRWLLIDDPDLTVAEIETRLRQLALIPINVMGSQLGKPTANVRFVP